MEDYILAKIQNLTVQTMTCGRRFHRNCFAELNETWYKDSIEGVLNARLYSGHSAPPGGRLHFSKNTEFDCSDFDMC